jgi:transcriptional regulator with XRE-family HTH domain
VTPLPSEVHDFQSLVLWLVRTHHGGKHYRMAKHLGIGTALIPNWAKGKVKNPTMQAISLLCDAYDLNPVEVRALVAQRPYRKVDPSVSDLKSFVQWLAKEHHDGTYSAMAKRIGVSTALVYQWRDGLVNEPSLKTLTKICRAYDLDESDVSTRISKPR